MSRHSAEVVDGVKVLKKNVEVLQGQREELYKSQGQNTQAIDTLRGQSEELSGSVGSLKKNVDGLREHSVDSDRRIAELENELRELKDLIGSARMRTTTDG